jgi:glutamine amidotransferase of anthranilate synthase or aminodeoxychorismate synthase
MILLIDNYDSFSYNLYQMLGSITPDITVIRNDEKTVDQICAMKPDGIVLSPGPGRPAEAGVCIPVIRQLAGKIPMLGVCLGHQAICEAFGGTVSYAMQLMHGKTSKIRINTDSPLFKGMNDEIMAARYHSLAAVRESLPDCLKVIAESSDGEIMAVEHRELPVYGVQFHPESILTPDGKQIAEHFLEVI